LAVPQGRVAVTYFDYESSLTHTGNRYAALGYCQPRMLPIGHRYAVILVFLKIASEMSKLHAAD